MKITKRLLLTLCTGVTACAAPPAGSDAGFTPISPQKAKEMMDAGQELLILDVREQDEYDSGHIPGAKLLPLSTIRPASAAPDHPKQGPGCAGLLPQRKAQPQSLPPSVQAWDIPTSAIWAVSWTGPTKKNKKQHKSAGGISAGAFAVLSYKKGKWKAIFPALSGSPVPLPLLPCPPPADSSAFGSAESRNKVQ